MTPADQPLSPIQQAVYDRLRGDATLMDLLAGDGIYDHVPEDAPYPYVVIGEATTVPANRHRGFGRSTVEHLHVWTKSRGHAQGLAIEARVVQLLDHQPLIVVGHHVVAVRFEFSQTLTDPESPGDLRHIPIHIRVDTEQES